MLHVKIFLDKKSLHQMEPNAKYVKLKIVFNVLLLSPVHTVLEIIYYPKTEPSVFHVLMEKSYHLIDKLVLLVK